ncbi:conserved hypothetical protein [Thermotomaculum hydrothermale]|uniref:DUF2188 domain-containing protein n=1 Tax=Thermotomaculum hydrothermale TaxID=981385 RepID=A0A7R6PRR4_9BACT|nr:DUF2188 domain-containing protein [Thermotomaculum hydrothermale]BBB33131.1 conserved hypothetical protein [Thermotomaculum hydrothermale]
MKKTSFHVVPQKGKWAIKQEKKTPLQSTRTKKEAIEKAKKIAKNKKTELIIHNKNGKISNRNSYGNDPCPPKDKK